MFCPQCGNQWDVQQGFCSHCGFTVPRARSASSELTAPPDALQPGMRLRNSRYSLQEKVAQRHWSSGVGEASWIGRDFQAHGEAVLICEIFFPDAHALAIKATLRDTTHALISAGNNPTLPTLKDVFDENNRAFFVFEAIKEEALQVRLRRLRYPLSEPEALDMCREISSTLEILARQALPLVHGCICPDHIYFTSDTSRFMLSNLSPLIARGDMRFLQGMTGGGNGPFSAPEFSQGVLDTRSDLYSLMATTYYAVTGAVPPTSGGVIPHAQHLNAALSLEFDAMLAKGLHPALHQRYQHPSELYQDVLAIQSRTTRTGSGRLASPNVGSGHLVPPNVGSGRLVPPNVGSGRLAPLGTVRRPTPSSSLRNETVHSFGSDGAATPGLPLSFPIKLDLPEPENDTLLPAAETLPPMSQGHDRFEAAFFFTAVVVSFAVITSLGAFHM
jgi:hypothetical protein